MVTPPVRAAVMISFSTFNTSPLQARSPSLLILTLLSFTSNVSKALNKMDFRSTRQHLVVVQLIKGSYILFDIPK